MKTSTLHNILSNINKHPRDLNIQFFEEGHKYVITSDPESKYTSVTTWNHGHFPKFDADKVIEKMMKGKNWNSQNKYWGMTSEQIKELWNSNKSGGAAEAGTNMHYEIECFMNNPELTPGYTHKDLLTHYQNCEHPDNLFKDTLEWKYFLNFVNDFPELKPYRTEWTVYNEDVKLAGSIDMVYENEDGTLSIYDWKRAKEITSVHKFNECAISKAIRNMPNTNYWHYALQLNTYKSILENKYEKTIKDLYLVRLHPDALERNYELIHLPILNGQITRLFEEKMNL